MGIHIEWDNQTQTTIRQVFDPHWTWDDFYGAKQKVDAMIDAVQQPVGLILDMPANVVIPANALSHGKQYIDTEHPNLFLIVIVSTNQLLQMLYSVFGKVYPIATHHVRMAATMDAAREILSHTRHSVTML
ncbi:MAG: hypothetical protein ABI690_03495 [Chloroflexota bacterium]